MIAIIDYGMGNIHSVQKALQLSGVQTLITNKPEELKKADKLILPGVGAFADALLELKKQRLIPTLKVEIKNKKPFLGICLGMQLLFNASEEAEGVRGLGILKGVVKRFKHKSLKVPHIGWNALKKISLECPLLKDIPDYAYVYFCHSYYVQPEGQKITAATTDYGTPFTSVVWEENIYGVQFHPEKSQQTGLQMIKNFVNLC